MTICLSLIVKNEAAVIRRCLDSVRPLIDCWCIVDTGSTDGTQDIIRQAFSGIPGELHERPWVDFATNRSEALALARGSADYTFVIDADDVLEIPRDFLVPKPLPSGMSYSVPELTADSYDLNICLGNASWRRPQLVKNTLPWRYRGVLHELLVCDEPFTRAYLPLTIQAGVSGARSADPDKYRKDAAILEEALSDETEPSWRARYTFYLAQSWRDCGEKEKAITRYLERSLMGAWQEEVYVALLNAGRLMEQCGYSDIEILLTYGRANLATHTRAEGFHAAAWFCRKQNRFEKGYQFAERGAAISQPADGLFVEPWIYQWGLLDEIGVSGFYSGHHREAVDACEIILAEGNLPEDQRTRVVANANFSRRKLLEAP